MDDSASKPAILGLTGYLLGGLTLAATYLVAHIALGLSAVHDTVGSPLTTAVRDGTGLVLTMLAYLAVAPLLVVAVSALMGRHGAHTAQPAAGAAAVSALIGVPLVWVNLAIAALVVAAVHGAQGLATAFDDAVDVLLSSAVATLVILGPLVALAGVVAMRASAWASAKAEALGHAPHFPRPVPAARAPRAAPRAEQNEDEDEIAPDLLDHPVTCPRCSNPFSVTGARPLAITCPACGKTGTIR